MARVVLCFALLSLSIAAGARAEVLRYKFHAGQVLGSRTSVAGATMTGQTAGEMTRMQFRSTGKQLERVQSLGGGVVALEVTDLPGTYTVNSAGQTQTTKGTTSKSLIRMTERGKFLSRRSLGARGEAGGAGQLQGLDAVFGLNFPERDLKPGDTWEDTITAGEGTGGAKVHVTWKYLSRETFRGRECAKISTTLSMPLDSGAAAQPGLPATLGRVTGTVTTYFDPKAGQEVYSSGSIVIQAKADLSAIAQEAGELATVSKINLVQSLVTGGK
jgi:hypothetical protein